MPDQVEETLLEAGFTQKQVEALTEIFALYPHGHTIDDIAGLEEMLEEDDSEEDED